MEDDNVKDKVSEKEHVHEDIISKCEEVIDLIDNNHTAQQEELRVIYMHASRKLLREFV